ncbi:MAG: ABC transporter substrate-binding protein [Fastidiosipilaceae bacterium]|jgi:ABC-type Fe3+ transport system substrate-binding protein
MLDFNKTIYELTEDQPNLLDFFIANGLSQLENKLIVKSLGRKMTLNDALSKQNIDAEGFAEKLSQYLAQTQCGPDASLNQGEMSRGDIDIKGVLPCPIHLPLRDAILNETQRIEDESGIKISYDLRTANLGVSWITDEPDIILSAGFEMFFSKKMKVEYLQTGIYSGGDYPVDKTLIQHGAELKDPNGYYHIVGIVPAIFIVNKDRLEGRQMPRSWADLLNEQYADSVAIPKGDLDLYNAILLTIKAHHGVNGLLALGRSMAADLHPSQMTRSKTSTPLPLVNVAPYFFSQMVTEPNLEIVWPEDGAIVSPIFMLAKMNKPYVKDVADAICSTKIADIFNVGGKFPATAPGTQNFLKADQRLMFAGWDYLNSHDIEAELAQAEELFHQTSVV